MCIHKSFWKIAGKPFQKCILSNHKITIYLSDQIDLSVPVVGFGSFQVREKYLLKYENNNFPKVWFLLYLLRIFSADFFNNISTRLYYIVI